MRLETALQVVGTRIRLAKVLGITRAGLHLWGVEWDQSKSDRVVGAMIREGLIDERIGRAMLMDFDVSRLVRIRANRLKRRAQRERLAKAAARENHVQR